MLNSSASAKPF